MIVYYLRINVITYTLPAYMLTSTRTTEIDLNKRCTITGEATERLTGFMALMCAVDRHGFSYLFSGFRSRISAKSNTHNWVRSGHIGPIAVACTMESLIAFTARR